MHSRQSTRLLGALPSLRRPLEARVPTGEVDGTSLTNPSELGLGATVTVVHNPGGPYPVGDGVVDDGAPYDVEQDPRPHADAADDRARDERRRDHRKSQPAAGPELCRHDGRTLADERSWKAVRKCLSVTR
jgi:hypothetical protein